MSSNHLIFCHPLFLLPSILVDSKLIMIIKRLPTLLLSLTAPPTSPPLLQQGINPIIVNTPNSCLTLVPLFCPQFVKLCVDKTFCPTWIHLHSYASTPQLWAVNHSLLGLVIKSQFMLSACSVSPSIIVPFLRFVGRVGQTGNRAGRGFVCWSWRAPWTEAAAGAALPTRGSPRGWFCSGVSPERHHSMSSFFLDSLKDRFLAHSIGLRGTSVSLL